MKRIWGLLLVFVLPIISWGQYNDSINGRLNYVKVLEDSVAKIKNYTLSASRLPDVTVHSFAFNKIWTNAPSSVAVLSEEQLHLISTNSLLPALNTIPGVRMEERSPNSFRLSVRGSLLRSPFGVRDVKVYWNNLPLTDGSGNTYLNLIDLTQIGSAEITKGATASMYGAGKGGLLLLENKNDFTKQSINHYSASLSGGSFGTLQESFLWKHQTQNFSYQLMQSHQQSDGYRQQSASNKNNITYTASYKIKKNQFNFSGFYTRLHYQTPGGITLAQMQKNPTLARQAVGNLPSALQQKTAIDNNTFFAGLNHLFTINKSISTDASIVFHHTDFINPFITNYEIRNETNTGVNAKIVYQHQLKKVSVQWITGGEYLFNHSAVEDDGNRNGNRDTVQLKDNIFASQWFGFSQVQMFVGKFTVQMGISANNQTFAFERLSDKIHSLTNKHTDIVAMPRLSIGYTLMNGITIYGEVAKGFSPPTLAETRPSNRVFNTTLQAEYGWNESLGIKGKAFEGRLLFDVNAYRFHLQNAIVLQNNTDGTQYFSNAGSTKQDGMEMWLQFQLLQQKNSSVKQVTLSESYSYQPYRFTSYQQGSSNYSGKKLTGVPENGSVSTVSIKLNGGYFMNISYNYSSAIPLTDANDVYAKAYHLLQSKIGWEGAIKKLHVQLFVGGDNLLNEQYSLGNDINAAGKRFYNPAPKINFYGGCKLGW